MIKKSLIFSFGLISSTMLYAAAPAWTVQPNTSQLTFTATQNNAPLNGKFASFKSEINFAPDQLDSSRVHLLIDTKSITTTYNQVRNTLTTADWFDVANFPQAEFTAQSFSKTGDKTYTANGQLSIKGKTHPVTLNFTLEEYSPTHAVVKGQTEIKRTDFNVGQGEWSSTAQIKDEVKIEFVIVADNK